MGSIQMTEARYLTWEDLKVGLSHSFSILLSESVVHTFLQLSGDFNPLHADEAYAAGTKFKKRVVPGMLLAGFFSQLVGMHIPGKNSFYLGQDLSFRKPAFIGDTIVITGCITHVSASTKIITLDTTVCHAQTQTVLVTGKAKVLYL